MPRPSLLALTALVLLPAGALAEGGASDPAPDEAGHEAPSAIVNGEIEERFPAVVAVGADFGGPYQVCTATLITDRVFLTAAHCGADLPVEAIVLLGQVFVGPSTAAVEQQYGIDDYIGHPDYRPLDNGQGLPPLNDIGIGVLDAPADVEPIFFNTRELDEDDIDTELLSVGYSATSGEGGGNGVKRSAVQIVAGFTEDTIRTANSLNPNNGNICSGDSGGPMMQVDADGRGTIWAVHSYGDQNCTVFASSTRTDLFSDWLLDRIEEVHDARDLCAINGLYANDVCDADCEDDPECDPPDAADDDDDDGATGAGCRSSLGGGSATWLGLLLPLGLVLRRRRATVLGTTWAGLALVLCLAPSAALAAKPTLPTLSEADMQKVRDGKIVLTKTKDAAGVTTVNAVCELAAPASELWPIIFSVEHIKASSSSIKELVATRDETGADGVRHLDLSYMLKVGWTEIRYSVRRTYVAAEETMSWVLDKTRPADIEWTEGSYSVYPGSAEGRTLFLYRARIETGKSIPAWLEEDLTESSLKKYLKYLKDTAEK